MRALLIALLLAASPSVAKEKFNVKMPDTFEAGGKTLKLNGMGLRVKFIVRVYVAGLYVENTTKDPEKIIASDEARSVQLKMLRDLDKKTVAEAIAVGFEKNSKKQLPALKERLDKLTAGLKDLKEGELFTLTYVPGKGTTVKGAGAEQNVPGKDFADALFAVWLGGDPVDPGCKKGMLGED
jgi:Chalcone isomerase-like